MAIIACPSCDKPISDKASQCQHCDFALGSATPDDLERKAQMKRFKQQQKLQNQSMLAILLFISGFGMMYWGGALPGDTQHNIAILMAVVGFVWYGINRVRIVLAKRK